MPEDDFHLRIYKIYVYIFNIIIITSIYLSKKIIIISGVLIVFLTPIYIILEYNLESKIYNLIYIPYILPYINIYNNLLLIYLYLLISLISTKIIYDHMYDKSFGLTNAK
jgi:hypothetical protein